MKVDVIQTSFAGGEFGPSLFGRTDVSQYDTACAIVENFLPRPYGSIISTPGTEYINACKTGGSTGFVRLLEFTFSQTDSYVIEMGVEYFRFYTNGGVVTSGGSTPYEVAHTYTESELNDVQISQLNDVIYIAHPDHAPAKLTRLASNSWTLEDFAVTGGPYVNDNVIYSGGTTSVLSSATITPSAVSGTGCTLSASANIFIASGSTLGHKNTFWKVGNVITDATTGLDVQGYVQITTITNPSTATATVIKNLSGTAATTTWAQGAWSSVMGWPARVTFHQQRLWWARTAFQPQNEWGSKPFTYEDYSVNSGDDDDAINIELISTESNDIKWMISGDSLISGTYGGEFTVQSGDGSPLTPSNTNATKQTSWGSEAIPPKRIGNFFYYVQRFGQKIRELFYLWDLNSYKSLDKTILAPHITGTASTDKFVDIAYQQNPDTILWCVCTNGTIATLTREIDQEVQAWARQITTGTYESIASIPSYSGKHDEVWVVVKRTINGSDVRYIERFYSQELPVRQDKCRYLHSALEYDAYTSYTTTTISLSATSGTNVVVTSSAAHFTSNDVSQRIRAIDSNGVTLGELKVTGFTSSTVVVGNVVTSFSTTAYAANLWGVSVETISGLGHLEAATVGVLADGGTDKPTKTVSNASITLAYDYFVVLVGIPYTQKLKTLTRESGSERGTSQGKIQRINEAGFKVNRSFKGFLIGDSTANLRKVQFRQPETLLGTPELLYTGTLPNITFNGNYAYGAQMLIHNQEPLPIEFLSIIMSLDTHDK